MSKQRNHNNFRENLKFAQEGELKSIELLLKKFPGAVIKAELHDTKSHDFSINLNGREVLLEVKEDVRVKDTGNVLIEFESWGKPSGIITTKANQWMMRLHCEEGVENLVFNVEALRYSIKKEEYTEIRKMYRTDSKNKLYFYTLEQLKNIEHINLGIT